MINMGELFRYPMLREVEMARVEIDYGDRERYLVDAGDLLFARRSLTVEGAGKCAIVASVDQETTWEGSIIRARLDRSKADPFFYFYYFLSQVGRRAIEGIVEQVAAAGIRGSDLRELRVLHPVLAEQRAIAGVLGALDDKIAVNERIVAAAMELGAAKAARVSASAMESAVLGDILELKYGKSLPAARRVAGEIPVFGSGGISGTHIEALLEGPGIVVGRKGTVGSVYWSEGGFFPIDTTFYVVCRGDGVSMEYAYFLLKGLGLEEMNSDSAIPGLNRDRALSVRIKVPDAHSIKRFTVEARELFAMSRVREQENQTLATLRGTLLPQLMSGRIRVKDAEKIVEDHV
ncbi:restriction endonuclease subunit S [Streptomyces sp. FL06-04B]|uniref:restriction endonuclease subunit S n=1 Tax=unclassified Streptomyces TaxID=2593676 RepID=UPI0029B80F15|nr:MULTISPECIES: restriction endonuclease subunit S [unclassified Streptomyces]MDX3607928.1 restriction endonuclease subunit S [Streptomyces sp. FL06-04B]MDX3739441.1 restriction endonuclease subunit S [Streptomyces sp. ID01-15D]